MTSILVTGASGFIGSFVVEEALRRGMDTWAAVRPTSSRRYIRDPRIHFIELDLSSEERLTEQLRGHNFDYVVHAAGATKCLCRDDFFTTNTDGTRHLATALMKLCMPLRRFVFISSLSVFGAIHEQQTFFITLRFKSVCTSSGGETTASNTNDKKGRPPSPQD